MLSSRTSTRSAFPLPSTVTLFLLLPQVAITSLMTVWLLSQISSRSVKVQGNEEWISCHEHNMIFGGKILICVYLFHPLPPVLLLPTCLQEREYWDIFFKPHGAETKDRKVHKKIWIRFYHSAAEIWPVQIKKQKSKDFFWWFGKTRFPCLKRSAVWECLGHLAIRGTSPAAGGWFLPTEPAALRAWLWCCWLPAQRLPHWTRISSLWAGSWLEPDLFLWDADAPPQDNTQDSGFLPYHLCSTLGFLKPKDLLLFWCKAGLSHRSFFLQMEEAVPQSEQKYSMRAMRVAFFNHFMCGYLQLLHRSPEQLSLLIIKSTAVMRCEDLSYGKWMMKQD